MTRRRPRSRPRWRPPPAERRAWRPVLSLGDMIDRHITACVRIAFLERDLREGVRLPRREVGRRALLIRELNKERVAMRNGENSLDAGAFREIKVDHASA